VTSQKTAVYTVPLHATEGLGSYSFSTSTLDGVSDQRHAPAALYPRKRTPVNHCTGVWVGPRARLDTEATGKSFRLCWGSDLDRPVVHPVARHYTDWAYLLMLSMYLLYSVILPAIRSLFPNVYRTKELGVGEASVQIPAALPPCKMLCNMQAVGNLKLTNTLCYYTPALYSGGLMFKSRPGDPLSWLSFFRVFPQSIKENTWTVL
jgi:hypothetical protein